MRLEPVAVRRGLESDAENLAALAIQVWLHTYATNGVSSALSRYVLTEFTAPKFEALIRNPNALVLVAEVDGHLVGYVVLRWGSQGPSPRSTTEVATLYVQEHFMRRGIGSALLDAARAEASALTGSSCVWLSVNAVNARAIEFYRKLGFVQDGVACFELGGERHANLVFVSGDA